PGNTSQTGFVFGGGTVGAQQNFVLAAADLNSKWSGALLAYTNTASSLTKCKFVANGATNVDIEPNSGHNSGGTANLSGSGTVTNALGLKSTVSYTLKVTDGGQGG